MGKRTQQAIKLAGHLGMEAERFELRAYLPRGLLLVIVSPRSVAVAYTSLAAGMFSLACATLLPNTNRTSTECSPAGRSLTTTIWELAAPLRSPSMDTLHCLGQRTV